MVPAPGGARGLGLPSDLGLWPGALTIFRFQTFPPVGTEPLPCWGGGQQVLDSTLGSSQL